MDITPRSHIRGRMLVSVLSVVLLQAAVASADLVTVVSDLTWLESTITEVNNTVPWPGVSSLPADATFTVPVVAGAAHVDNVTGSTNLVALGGVRFFRETFTLPPFTTLTVDLQISVDNDVHIFINDAALALEGSLHIFNFSDGVHHRLTIDATGDVTNGALGGQTFDSFTDPFSPANWIASTNEVILAIRNLEFDSGGFSFRMDVTTTDSLEAVPEPASLVLLATGLIGLGALRQRRSRR